MAFLSLLPGQLILGASMGSDFLPFAGLSLVQGLSNQLLGNPMDVPGPDQSQYGGNNASWGMDGSSKVGIYTENYGNGTFASMNSFGVSAQTAYGFAAPFNYGAMNPNAGAYPSGGRGGMQGYLPSQQQCAPYFGSYQQCPPPQGPGCYQPYQPCQSYNYGCGPSFNPGEFGCFQPEPPCNGGFWLQQFYGSGAESPFQGYGNGGGVGGPTPPPFGGPGGPYPTPGGGGYGAGSGSGGSGGVGGGAGGPGTIPVPPAPVTPVGPGTPGGLTPPPIVVDPPIPPLVLPPLTPPVANVPNLPQAQVAYDNLVPVYQNMPLEGFLNSIGAVAQLADVRGAHPVGPPGTPAPFTVKVSSYYNNTTQQYVPVQDVVIGDKSNYNLQAHEYNVGQLKDFSATLNNGTVGHNYQVTVNWTDGQSKTWDYPLNNSNNGQITFSGPFAV